MTISRSDRVERGCIRGCFQVGVHYADCEHHGPEYAGAFPCAGCAPEAAEFGLLCEGCFRRMRGLLLNARDLLGRMRSLAAQGKAVTYSPVKGSTVLVHSPEPVDADLADALVELPARFRRWGAPAKIVGNLDTWTGDEATILALAEWVIDTHNEDETGGRVWSLADAASKWGAERRERPVVGFPTPPREMRPARVFDEKTATGVSEWGFDALLESPDAARFAEVSDRQFRNWVAAGELTHAARLQEPDGRVRKWYRSSEIEAAAARMKARRSPGRPRKADGDTPTPME